MSSEQRRSMSESESQVVISGSCFAFSANVPLVPESHVLQRNNRVTANDTRQTAQSLTRDRIAFMRHGGTAFLAFAKEFFHFEHFGTLEMPKFRSPTIDARRDDSQRRHKF